MFKKKIFWISAISVILVLLICSLYYVGDKFVDYVLKVDEDKMIGVMDGEVYDGKQNSDAQKAYDAWVATVKQETIRISTADDLELWALYYHGATDSHKYVLAMHDYTVDHRDIAPAIKPFVEKGYHVITPDQRGRGYSDGDYVGMGYLEKDDVDLWIEEILKRDPKANIVLYGEGMGASTNMMSAGDKLSESVVAMISDSPYPSTKAIFKDLIEQHFNLPQFPFLDAAQLVGQLRYGFNINEANATTYMEKANVPTLFIHGDTDEVVPVSGTKALYEAYKGEKELLIVEGGSYISSSDTNPQLYYDTINNFLTKYLIK